VGCGQCSSACPNDLPVYELFQYVGKEVQKIFDYNPGISVEDEPPITTFREKELDPA
jgi:formate dehydrogenase subunit beta